MKTKIIMTVLIAFAGFGCSYKGENYTKAVDDLLNDLNAGGQPGQITLRGRGLLVRDSNGDLIVDGRVKVGQAVGESCQGYSKAELSLNKLSLFDSVETEILLSEYSQNKYINMGCKNLGAEETEGLVEETELLVDYPDLVLWAKKIFICGDSLPKSEGLNIKTEHLILRDATILRSSLISNIEILTLDLELQGSNIIQSKGVDLSVAVSAPSINLSVANEVTGSGLLEVESKGESCTEAK